MNWSPDFGETLLVRIPISFASGFAPPVLGLRSFRDPQRNDIQNQLAGWPAGPAFELRSSGDQSFGKVIDGIARAIPFVFNLLTEFSGPGGAPYSMPESAGEPEESENEVEDFPVIWAAPDTVARTLPWQLDPARRPDHVRTELVVTDRRLVVLGREKNPSAPPEVLWHAPRNAVRTARRMEFSDGHSDVKVTFSDGSWTRLTTSRQFDASKLAQFIQGTARPMAEFELTDGQRARIAKLSSGLPSRAEPPTFTLLPSGIVFAEIKVPAKFDPESFQISMAFMGPNGENAKPQPDDLK